MRLQHNISPPAPGRGGSRKRKRAAEDQSATNPTPNRHTPPSISAGLAGASGFNTFKVEPSEPLDLRHDKDRDQSSKGRHTNGRLHSTAPNSPRFNGSPNPHFDDDEGYTSSSSDVLPAHLMSHYEPSTNLVLGRLPAMVMYLLMKAKHRYALEQHEQLLEELRVVRAELKREKEEKEGALDRVLRGVFG